MNIGELLEFVNLLKKKLNYAGSNICSRVTGNGVLIDYEGQIIPIDIFIGHYSIAICFDIDDETEGIVDEMAKWVITINSDLFARKSIQYKENFVTKLVNEIRTVVSRGDW